MQFLKALFVSIQHPGEGGSVEEPTTRSPDDDEAMPPRPAVATSEAVEPGARIGTGPA